MLIEIHLLQNHSPSNPNRDDLGAPKTAWFGGKLRGRISSQCLKRSIRWWPEFRSALNGHLGTRTKLFPHLVGERLKTSAIPIDEHCLLVDACKGIARAEGAAPKQEKGKKADDRAKTPQLIFLQEGHVNEFVIRLERLRTELKAAYDEFTNPRAVFEQRIAEQLEELQVDEKEAKKLVGVSWVIARLRLKDLFSDDEPMPTDWNSTEPDPVRIAARLVELQESDEDKYQKVTKKVTKDETKELKDEASETAKATKKEMKEFEKALYAPLQLNAVDIALFGRMTTSDAFEDVEAACEVAHAISTNALQQEVDYFTAVDDMGLPGTGAGHIGENQFNSCTYYKYFSIDWNGLIDRLAGKEPTPPQLNETIQLAARAVKAFIEAAWHAVPTGKKKGHANNDPASAILVEVKERRVPTNYANAFVKPAAPTDEHDLIEDSINKLGQYVGCTARSNGVAVKTRIWHAARGESFEFTEPQMRGADGKCPKEKPPTQVPETIAVAGLPEVIRETLAAIEKREKGAAQ